MGGKLANVNKQNMSELVSCFLSRIMRHSKFYYQDNFVISINLLTSKVLAKLFSLSTHVSYVVFLKVRDYIYFKLSFIKLFTCFVFPSYPSPPTSWHNKVLCFYELTFLVVIMNGYHFPSKRTLFERTSFYRNFTRTVVWFSLPQYSHFFHIVSPRLDIIFSLPQMMTMISSPCPFYTRNTLFSR